MDHKMELVVWEPDFGLVSMNMQCIQAIFYIKVAKAPVEIKYMKRSFWSFKERTPYFRHGDIYLKDFNEIINYLRLCNYVIDYGLSVKQYSEAYAFLNMLVMDLKPITYYVWWFDKRNYEDLVSIWCIRALPLPYNYIYPRRQRTYTRYLIESLYPSEDDKQIINNAICDMTVKCFSCLAQRLGSNAYFYGDRPSILDTVVYSYLSPLLKIPFPSDRIPILLKTWPELVKYVERIDTNFFPEITYEEKYVTKVFSRERSQENDGASSLKTKFFMFAFVLCATWGFAVTKGIIPMNFFNLRPQIVS